MEFQRKFLCGTAVIIAGIFINSAFAAYFSSYQKDFGLAIPVQQNGKGWMDKAGIFVPVEGTLTDIDVTINLTHSSVCDLQIYLESPAGTRICLNWYDIDDFVPFEKDMRWTTFDDEAPADIEGARGPFRGEYRPKGQATLSVFDGENIYGIWQIEIYDAVYADSGTFHTVRLDFAVSPEPATITFLLTGLFWIRLQWQRK